MSNATGVTIANNNIPSLSSRLKMARSVAPCALCSAISETALLRTEPECSEQAEENVQQQESHTHHIVTDVIGPCLLVVATNILERTYLRNEDIAYAELALTVCLQPLNEVIVLPFTDADTKFETDIVETLLHHHGI